MNNLTTAKIRPLAEGRGLVFGGKKIVAKIKKHKIITALVVLILIGGVYYWRGSANSGQAAVSYRTEAAVKQTLITSVSGSGQMSTSNQVDLKPKVSGDIIKLAVAASQKVKKGDTIAQIDAANAYKTVRDAQVGLQSAQLALDKLKQPATANEKLQAQNAVTSAQTVLEKLKLAQPVDYQNAQTALETATKNLAKAHSDAFTAISNAYLNLPAIVSGLYDILYSEKISQTETSIGNGQQNISALFNATYEFDQLGIKTYQVLAETDYASAKTAYDANYTDFKTASIYSDAAAVENLLTETLAAVKSVAQAIKSENNYLAAWSDSRTLRGSAVFSQVATYQSNLTTYASQANSSVTNLSTVKTAIESYDDAIITANNTIKTLAQNQPLDLLAAQNSLKEKQGALEALLAGSDVLDIRSQELSLKQKQNALYDAQSVLADYTIRAPFDGVIASVNVKVGDAASAATVIATIITQQQLAEISLNEVDAAKIQVDQKVNLTFDAIDGLELTGKVGQINSIGTVSQGVVSYAVKIVLDAQDQRLKAGMSVNAAIITNVRTDALTVPNAAVKSGAGGGYYAQTLDASDKPRSQTVTIGLANDSFTEITSGLNEGDKVITQTISGSSANSGASQQRSSGGFGAIRIPGVGR